MTAYVTFVHELLGSLACEDSSSPKQFVDFHDLMRRYSVQYQESWLDRFTTDARSYNYAEIRRQLGKVGTGTDGRDSNIEHKTLIRISNGGREYLDRYETSAVATKLTRAPARVQEPIKAAFNSRPRSRKKFESQLWTGRYNGSGLKPGDLEEIRRLIGEIEQRVSQSELGNFDKAVLHGKVQALRATLASPKPDWRIFITLMIDLLSNPALAASIFIIDLGAKAIALAMQ